MNAAVRRLYADAANAKTKMENGFDLTNYEALQDLAFAKRITQPVAGYRCKPRYHGDAGCGLELVRQVFPSGRGEHQERICGRTLAQSRKLITYN